MKSGVEADAWSILIARYKEDERLIYSLVSRYFINECDRQDVIQEALISVAGKAETIVSLSPHQLTAYLYKTVENTCLNHLRKQRRSSVTCLSEETLEEIADARVSLDEILLSKELATTVNKVLAKLDETDRILLVGKYITGLTIKELAAEIGCSAGNVAVKLYRARRKAMALFAERGMIRHG